MWNGVEYKKILIVHDRSQFLDTISLKEETWDVLHVLVNWIYVPSGPLQQWKFPVGKLSFKVIDVGYGDPIVGSW